MLTDRDIENIIMAEEVDAIGYSGAGSPIQNNRALFLDYYNQLPYGDEQEGMSSIVTSDVYDVIEGMMPPLLRMFTQGRNIGTFVSEKMETPEQMAAMKQYKAQGGQAKNYEDLAQEKTAYANYVFDKNQGVAVLYNMLKDGLLQYTGWVKVFQDESEKTSSERYTQLSDLEVSFLEEKDDLKIVERDYDDQTGLYTIRVERLQKVQTQKIENIPPEETLISKKARDFKDPCFIGQRTPKTRSQLIEMGFKRDDVEKLAQEQVFGAVVETSRNHNIGGVANLRSSTQDKSQDMLYLGEYYMYIDVDQDGIAELWQCFFCEQKLLKKTRVDKHPYCVFVPTPIPHRAIGTCPAEHIAPLQYWRSTLVRQLNNNIYATNFNRVVVNDDVDIDDVLNVQHGGVIRINGSQPVQNAFSPFVVTNQVPAVLEAIGYADTQREQTSGVTAYNQGLDTESLNKTATGFQGVRDMSMMRIEVIARHAAETIKCIFEKIVENAQRYQDQKLQIKLFGKPMEIDPTEWRDGACCSVDVGIGSGDRQEKIANLNFILQQQKEFLQLGLPLTAPEKLYHTLDKLCIETGLKDAAPYFTDPAIPVDQIQAQNWQLQQQVQQLQQQLNINNQLAQAEATKGEFRLAEQKQKQEHDMNMAMADKEQEDAYHKDDMAMKLAEMQIKLSELELKANQNVEGSLI